MSDTNNSYIIETLRDGIVIMNCFMEELSPRNYLSVADLAAKFPEFSSNKIFRTIRTLESLGWLEKHPHKKSYKVGHPLLYLSHRYFQKLNEEMLYIKTEVNSFNVR